MNLFHECLRKSMIARSKRVELLITVLETVVLPPTLRPHYYYTHYVIICQADDVVIILFLMIFYVAYQNLHDAFYIKQYNVLAIKSTPVCVP